jgi:hypothetical protein
MAYPLSKEEIEGTMQEGSQAFLAGHTSKDSPYSKYSDKGRLWLKGFANAFYGSMTFTVPEYWSNKS